MINRLILNRRKLVVFLIVATLIGLLVLVLIIFLTKLSQNTISTTDNKEKLVSSPVSYISEKQENSGFEHNNKNSCFLNNTNKDTGNFEIGYVYLDSGDPSGTKASIEINLPNNFQTVLSSFTTMAFESEDVAIVFSASSEETGGFLNFIPENKQIINKNISGKLFRVNSENLLSDLQINYNFAKQYNNLYYYTNSFATGAECEIYGSTAKTTSCGMSVVFFNNSDSSFSSPVRIYCIVNDVNKVNICDQIIEGMNVEIKSC